MWVLSTAGCRWLGAAGSLAVTVGGWAAGTLPVRGGWGLWEPRGSALTTAGAILAYLGLTLLIAAWWQYGRLLRAGAPERVGRTLCWWAAPLLLAPPLYSADVYSYIAQGAMVLEGHDVYGAGPSVLAPGELGWDAAASVGGHWTDTPAPYGPVFLVLAQAVVKLTGGAVVPAVLGMRLIAVGALALIFWAVRGLSDARPSALWLAALNPLLLIHVVGGIHNDGLMIGLMLGGLLLAVRGRWVTGSVLVGLAVMVKSPAAVALLFVGIIVARQIGGGVRGALKGLLPGVVAAGVAALATLAAGTGFGWLRTQSVAATIHTALSVTSDLGLGLGLLVADDPEPVKAVVQQVGLAVAVGVIGVLGWRAWTGRVDPTVGLGMSLVALVALSPMVQPWYLLWGVCGVAAGGAGGGALGWWLAVASAALAYETAPSGHTPAYGFVLMGVAVVVGAVCLRVGNRPAGRWGSPRTQSGGGRAHGMAPLRAPAPPVPAPRRSRSGARRTGRGA
ncbi:polyprenol phosphomannose-dependent alpha 1,6 mannosyltransferase MptB [Streptomyces sp. NPDC046374]|uniref:polyprenol phosphomannose-dependent alpha 1,6 mannosyltransferase MptB n=1 Tax=Streptomyces sp. NPDC046374 TaxID=3154917 RepID=UPI0033DB269D